MTGASTLHLTFNGLSVSAEGSEAIWVLFLMILIALMTHLIVKR